MRAVLAIAIIAVLAFPAAAINSCGGATCSSPSTQTCASVSRVSSAGSAITTTCSCCVNNLTSASSTDSIVDCPSSCCNWYYRADYGTKWWVGMCDPSYSYITATWLPVSGESITTGGSCSEWDWSTSRFPGRMGYFSCGYYSSLSCNSVTRSITASVYYNSSYSFTLATNTNFVIQSNQVGCALAAAVGLAFGIIIAIVIGILVAIIACIVCCVCCICKKSEPQTIVVQQQPGMMQGQPMNV